MNTVNNNNNKRRFGDFGWFEWTAIVIFVILAGMIAAQAVYYSCNLDWHAKSHVALDSIHNKAYVSMIESLEDTDVRLLKDSLSKTGRINESFVPEIASHVVRQDSVLSVIVANQQTVIKRQEDIINDLRQEANSNIDKTNALLSFWVAVMALLGIFTPLIFQIKLNHDAKQKSDEMRQQLSADIDKEKRKLSDLSVKVDNKLRELSEKVDKNLHQLQSLSQLSTLRLNAEYRIMPEISSADNIYSLVWSQSILSFDKVVEREFDQPDTLKSRALLMTCLMQIHVTLAELRRDSARKKHRHIAKVQDEIRLLLVKVKTQDYQSWDAFKTEFMTLIRHLRTLDFYD